MRLSECKENMSSFAEREHSRSYHAAKIQNIFDMVVTLQPFLVKFTRFLDHRGITVESRGQNGQGHLVIFDFGNAVICSLYINRIFIL